jgi:hypothetical protein
MRTSSVYFSDTGRYGRFSDSPMTLKEALRIYFSILSGVTVCMLAFHLMFPQLP